MGKRAFASTLLANECRVQGPYITAHNSTPCTELLRGSTHVLGIAFFPSRLWVHSWCVSGARMESARAFRWGHACLSELRSGQCNIVLLLILFFRLTRGRL